MELRYEGIKFYDLEGEEIDPFELQLLCHAEYVRITDVRDVEEWKRYWRNYEVKTWSRLKLVLGDNAPEKHAITKRFQIPEEEGCYQKTGKYTWASMAPITNMELYISLINGIRPAKEEE